MAAPELTIVTGGEPEVVDQVVLLPVQQIEEGERLRPIDQDWVEVLIGLLDKQGQHQAIEVCRLPGRTNWRLVTGGHRLAAARALGWATVKAIVVSSDAAERRQKEIWENLGHSGLGPIDRAAFVFEAYALEKARSGLAVDADPRTAGANARWGKALKDQADDANVTMTFAYGFSERAAAKIGISVVTLQRDLALHRGLAPSLLAQIRALPIASNAGQLRALAKLSEGDQRAVVALLKDGVAKSVADGLGRLHQKPLPDPSKKALSAFIGSWARMTPHDQREALRQLAQMKMPRGVKLQLQGIDHD